MQFINIISSIMLIGAIFCIAFSIIGAIISSIELDKTIINRSQDSDIPIAKLARISSLIRKGSFIIVFNQLLASLPIAILTSFWLSKTLRLGIIIGALFAAIIAMFCIFMCTISNALTALRCATQSKDSLKRGFNTAYNAGGIIGTFFLGAVLFIILIYLEKEDEHFLIGSAVGSTIISTFIKISGGIFTKSADIGADLIGKLGYDLKEDDSRNPAMIADNIGDNIGDAEGAITCTFSTLICSFMGAIFVGVPRELICSIILSCGISYFAIFNVIKLLPSKKQIDGKSIMSLMNLLMFLSGGVSIIIFSALIVWEFAIHNKNGSLNIVSLTFFGNLLLHIIPFMLGIVSTYLIMQITNLYTSVDSKTVQSIISVTKEYGGAMNIIAGFSNALFALFLICTVIISCCVVIILSHNIIFRVFNVKIFEVVQLISIFLLSKIGMSFSVITRDAYGPIVDNAGGIVEASGCGDDARKNTDILDEVGNTTKSLTKSYIIAIIIVNMMILFDHIVLLLSTRNIPIYPDLYFIIGAILGASTTALFSGYLIDSVYKIAHKLCDFIDNILSRGVQKKDGIKSIEINENDDSFYTQTFNMMGFSSTYSGFIGLIILLAPIMLVMCIVALSFVGSEILDSLINNKSVLSVNDRIIRLRDSFFNIIVGVTIGASISSIILSLVMTISGAIWDNVKKGSKNDIPSDQIFLSKINLLIDDRSSDDIKEKIQNEIDLLVKSKIMKNDVVIGDTVGDPFKDTAGPGAAIIPKFYLIIFYLIFMSMHSCFFVK